MRSNVGMARGSLARRARDKARWELDRLRSELKYGRRRAKYTLHERLLSNRSSRKAFRARPGDLGHVQQVALEQLSNDGIAVTHFDDLWADRVLWDALAVDMDRFVADVERKLAAAPINPLSNPPNRFSEKDAYLVRRYPQGSKRWRRGLADPRAVDAKLAPNDPWLRLGLSSALLQLVNAYRGLQTKLVDLDQWYTTPVGNDAERIKSQNWHRDPEDLHVVKVFLYFSDVDEEAGPFQYIPGSQPGGRYGDLWPWRLRGGNYPPQDQVADRISEDEHLTATGKRGTLILCDSSGLHRGGFARSKSRILATYTYVSPASLASRKARRFTVGSLTGGMQFSEEAISALD